MHLSISNLRCSICLVLIIYGSLRLLIHHIDRDYSGITHFHFHIHVHAHAHAQQKKGYCVCVQKNVNKYKLINQSINQSPFITLMARLLACLACLPATLPSLLQMDHDIILLQHRCVKQLAATITKFPEPCGVEFQYCCKVSRAHTSVLCFQKQKRSVKSISKQSVNQSINQSGRWGTNSTLLANLHA